MSRDSNNLHWIEISRSALINNVSTIKSKLTTTTKICAMVKANAYGHGLAQITPLLTPLVDFFGVNTLAEALQIRDLNLTTPIVIAGPIATTDFEVAISNNISLCIHSLNYLQGVRNLPLTVHLKINTGMNRLGIDPSELPSTLSDIQDSKLHLEGIYTHFHSSDIPSSTTQTQFEIFQKCVAQTKAIFPTVIAHSANSSAIFSHPQTHLDMVRPGISLYGLFPGLIPVLSWKAQVVQPRLVGTNQTVGYAQTFKATKPTYTAILPVGYSDGLDRKLSNVSPFIGRIAMNFSTIKTHELLPEGSTFEIIGSSQTADHLASTLSTINYEIVARLNPTIPRIVIN